MFCSSIEVCGAHLFQVFTGRVGGEVVRHGPVCCREGGEAALQGQDTAPGPRVPLLCHTETGTLALVLKLGLYIV